MPLWPTSSLPVQAPVPPEMFRLLTALRCDPGVMKVEPVSVTLPPLLMLRAF